MGNAIDHFSKPLSERIEDPDFRSFLQKFLEWDPNHRISPSEALKSKWILDGLP